MSNILKCKYCGKECKNKNSLVQHEIRCKENPNKIDTSNSWNNKNRQVWNKGLTKETSKSLQKASETYKKNRELGLHKSIPNPMNNPNSRKKLSETCLRKSKEGTWHTSLAKSMHINYNGVDLHGSWEFKYAKFLDFNNIRWERCKDRFPYTYKNKLHYYTPDFYLPEDDKYIEIKGYITDKDYAKWKQIPKNISFEVLTRKDLILLGIDV